MLHGPTDAASRLSAQGFDAVRAQALNFGWRPEFDVDEMPSPQRIAPYSLALEVGIESPVDVEIGSGRLIILHDPDGNPAWDGVYRCVSYARADVDTEMVTDPLLAEVGWTWLTDALYSQQAVFHAASGTVTAVSSRSFGALESENDRAEIEIRASWTADLDDRGILPHLAGWQELMCSTAGLPPLAPGIVALPSHAER